MPPKTSDLRVAACTASVILATLASACGRDTALPEVHQIAATLTGNHHFDHFILIVLENEDAIDVMKVPYMDSLARRGVLFKNYYAVAHPSYPNYLAMVGGHTYIDDEKSTTHDPDAYERKEFGDAQLLIDAPSIADRLEAQHTSWNAFAEDYPIADQYPQKCDFSRRSGSYARKHFPFLSFKAFRDHPELCAHIRNLKWFRADSLAGYTFIAPNMIHDGHDAPLTTAVEWLRSFVDPLIANKGVMDSTLIVVTFDESANDSRGSVFGLSRPNMVYTVFLGNMVKAGTSSDVPFNHYNLLRTVEANFGLSPSLMASGTAAIDGVWK
ncbi:MAG: alkaline phosphatase family protein [Gemmatimonadaceae bacterium]